MLFSFLTQDVLVNRSFPVSHYFAFIWTKLGWDFLPMFSLKVQIQTWETFVLFATLALEYQIFTLIVQICVFFPIILPFRWSLACFHLKSNKIIIIDVKKNSIYNYAGVKALRWKLILAHLLMNITKTLHTIISMSDRVKKNKITELKNTI